MSLFATAGRARRCRDHRAQLVIRSVQLCKPGLDGGESTVWDRRRFLSERFFGRARERGAELAG
jgi:hypothetical protein